jgi:hypothetical protein
MVSRVRRHLSFVDVRVPSDADGTRTRPSMVERLITLHVRPEALDVDRSGCRFIINERDASAFTAALANDRAAVTVRAGCARIALTRTATDWPLPPLDRLLLAMNGAGIDIVHLNGDATSMTIVVDEHDADRVVSLLSFAYQRPAAVAPPAAHAVA